MLGAAPHRSRVMDHFVERPRQRAVVTERGHGQRIADEDHIHARFIQQARRRIVVSRQANNFLGIGRGTCSRSLALQELGHSNFAVARVRNNTHDGLRYRSLTSGYSPVPNGLRIANSDSNNQNFGCYSHLLRNLFARPKALYLSRSLGAAFPLGAAAEIVAGGGEACRAGGETGGERQRCCPNWWQARETGRSEIKRGHRSP